MARDGRGVELGRAKRQRSHRRLPMALTGGRSAEEGVHTFDAIANRVDV